MFQLIAIILGIKIPLDERSFMKRFSKISERCVTSDSYQCGDLQTPPCSTRQTGGHVCSHRLASWFCCQTCSPGAFQGAALRRWAKILSRICRAWEHLGVSGKAYMSVVFGS